MGISSCLQALESVETKQTPIIASLCSFTNTTHFRLAGNAATSKRRDHQKMFDKHPMGSRRHSL